jgi:hypothetical protein
VGALTAGAPKEKVEEVAGFGAGAGAAVDFEKGFLGAALDIGG